MNKYVLKNHVWWEVDENEGTLKNFWGGWHCGEPSNEDEVVLAEDFMDLDWTKTSLIKPDSRYGWITPDGTFYGCDWCDHEDVALLVFGCDSSELEDRGFVKISFCILDGVTDYFGADPNKAQKDTLLMKGLELHSWDQD